MSELGRVVIDCYHAQLRLVHQYMPHAAVRARRLVDRTMPGGTFCYVTAAVDRRETRCPAHVVQQFRDLGYIIIHIEEPQT